MFTVVIAEKQLLDDIKNYGRLLDSLIDKDNTTFCEWHTEEDSFQKAVPKLARAIGGRKKWRALIVCGVENLYKNNPFDFVNYDEEIQGVEDKKSLHKIKMACYEKAVNNPLVKLAARLGQWPAITSVYSPDAPLELLWYQEEMEKKLRLWQEITKNDDISTRLPEELLCIARRTGHSIAEDVKDSWSLKLETGYSRFYDYNMYFDNMRYLLFDIHDKGHLDYNYDYLCFLATLLIIAGNKTPRGCLASRRIYQTGCINDKQKLQQIITKYDKKLANTEIMLQKLINSIETSPKEYLKDEDVELIFNVVIEPARDDKYKTIKRKCFVDEKIPGIATDVPNSENSYWKKASKQVTNGFYDMLKIAKYMLKVSTRSIHNKKTAIDKDIRNSEKWIGELQYGDIKEYAEHEEKNLVIKQPHSLYDVSDYTSLLEEKDLIISNMIDKRMKKGTILGLNLAIFVLVLSGLVPFLYSNYKVSGINVKMPFILSAGSLLLIMSSVFVILYIFRYRLVCKFREFNKTARKLMEQVEASNTDYAVYLGRICNLMRAYSVLGNGQDKPVSGQCRVHVLKKHILDIQCEREILKDVFGQYIASDCTFNEDEEDYYDYNYYIIKNYDYPVPGVKTNIKKIVFVEDGNYAVIKSCFVDRIWVKREEIYD